MTNNGVLLELKNITKQFGPTYANNNVSFSIHEGEIHGIAGENGCGKSTLMSIIAGMLQKDSGEMYLKGNLYEPKSPKDGNNNGIGMVVQELGLVSNLTIGMNMFLGSMSSFSKFGILNMRNMNREAVKYLSLLDSDSLTPNKKVGELSVEQKKMVELGRALATNPTLLILDELTQAISADKRDILIKIIRDFTAQGKSIIIISHNLEELIELSDRITIMKDGAVVDTLPSVELNVEKLKKMMIGREIKGDYYRNDMEASFGEKIVMQVKELTTVNKELQNISLELHESEILGICGISDSGSHTLGKVLFGIEKYSSGTISVLGEKIKTPLDAIKVGIGYCPKDRDFEGLMLNTSIRNNLCIPSLPVLQGMLGYVSKRAINSLAKHISEDFEIKATGIEQIVNSLSGGNKQKVNLGRWMSKDLKVLILDCPTRGVDVGVKAYIYDMMKKAKAAGLAMILITDELPEAIGLSDRLIVLKHGEISGLIERGIDMSEETIIEVMM
jgi:ribose transport system ATP-binding protein